MSSPPTPDASLTAAELVQRGRDPGSFTLLLDDSPADGARVVCSETVRALPGRRLVCRGSWQGQAIFVKIYFDDGRHWQAEQRGLQALHQHAITAPAVLYAGTADGGHLQLIILAAIAPAQSLALAWAQAADDAARVELLHQTLAVLAQHHGAGLLQDDINLDNFLLAGGQLYTLDGGGIRVTGAQALSASRSRDNLAQFFAQLYPHFDALIEIVLPGYCRQRGWDADRLTPGEVRQRVVHRRHARQRQFLKKIFRDCSAFRCERSWRSFRVSDRALSTPALRTLLADPDASLQQPGVRFLKQGNTSTLWTVPVDGRQLVIKRYNIKGYAHRLSRAWRRTRAAVSWKNAHRLAMYGILGARPVALHERRFGPLRGRAWLIMEYIEGEDLTRLCGATDAQQEDTAVAIRHMTTLLARLADCAISHGDMKGTNFLQTQQGIAVIDLDAMQEHVSQARFRRAQRHDLQRFMRNWESCPAIAGQFSVALQRDVAGTAR